MSQRHYQQELARLKELGAEFAAAHPALAPMLAGPSADPDVERLLEAVAFQTGLLREKLEDDFPELIHDMARLVCPHYLRPIPATTIVAFVPKPSLATTRTIAAGIRLESAPVEGTRCQFRTCSEVEMHPLQLVDAEFFQQAGQAPSVTLSLALNGLSLAGWSPRKLRLFLAGDYAVASDLYLLLRRHLRRIVISDEEGGRSVELPADCLQAAGFAADEAVIPFPAQAFPGYRLLQECLAIPNRFLFLDLIGWERWLERGSGSRFKISFELSPFSISKPRVTRESFVLFAAPAVNLFSHDAAPVLLDHQRERYLVLPSGLPPDHGQIFTVDAVTGIIRGRSGRRAYRPFELFHQLTPDEPAYHTTITRSPVNGGLDVHLSVAFQKDQGLPETETLSIDLTCTNGTLPERLRVGDLSHANASTPDYATFSNITPIVPSVMPVLGENMLWRLVSHHCLNRRSLASAESLKALLSLCLFEGNRDQAALAANRRRIDGIEEVLCQPVDRLVRGMMMRGLQITLSLRGDYFASAGDLLLFASVLDEFFAGYISLNTFTHLTVNELNRGESIQWQPRLGQQPLL
jgi:type VI secretion system protein ImpG